MLINGIDLSTLGVELYDRVLTSNDVQTTEEWLEGDIQPTFVRQQDKFKKMTLSFLVLDRDEDSAFRTMSKLTAILKKATILFDDIHLLFDVALDGEATQKRLKNGNFVQTFVLQSDYAKGETEIYTTDATATSYFNLRVLYYQDGNILIRSETVPLRSGDFKGNDTLASLGIDVNKYKPNYYNNGRVTNLGSSLITYETLYELQTLIINYAPTVYTKDVNYLLLQEGTYVEVTSVQITFTKAQVDAARNIGDLVDLNFNRPNGHLARVNFNEDLTFTNLLNWSNLQVYFEPIQNEQDKNITIVYTAEESGNSDVYNVVGSQVLNIKESDFILNTTLADIINVNAFRPANYYEEGAFYNEDADAIVTYDSMKASYEVRYNLTTYTLWAEFYYGNYPDWSRIQTLRYQVKYNSKYENTQDLLGDIGINLDTFYDSTYEHGVVFRAESYETFNDVINAGVIQIYYTPIDYHITVDYYQEDTLLGSEDVVINSNMFLTTPPLGSVIDINAHRPEGYIFDEESSYDGPVTLQSILANSPITIAYKEVDAVRTKSIVIKYKQELASAFSTINTSILTIEEAEVGGGIRLKDLININAYKPDYYQNGIIDGYSDATFFTFEELQGEYSVLYMAETYTTQVRYYTDEVANENWIGSSQLNYTVLDFSVDTVLTDLGLNINAFKPSYCGNGEVRYTGPITFAALRDVPSIDIVYTAETEPVDPDGIDYPHRILFLQHNDMGDYEWQFKNWTLNHAYINTGVTCQDMSKLTVLVDTYRVFEETAPLYDVNVDSAYLFGSITPDGSYYLRYNNNTKYTGTVNPTGINTFSFKAGRGTPELVIEESSSEGFSSNTGITASSRAGYSYGTLTYTHLLESNSAPVNVPLYLFACDMNGFYRGGIAGVGIKSCKIYYDNELIRDYVPVATYDKIGNKISPSNCLYDKVTQTFFEDATNNNSFNIIDDPDYVDTNPEHHIGMYYVNYYRDGVLFNTSAIYCRESDFIDAENPWVPYEQLLVDYYQPKYFKAGVISNLSELGDIAFNNVNGFIFRVDYALNKYVITVNYYKDSAEEGNLLASEEVELTENSFLSVPTFGEVIDIQKHKLAGYKPNWEYNDSRVTLSRILDHAPYNIVYTKVENPAQYNIHVRYYREGFGSLNYSTNPLQYYHDLGTRDFPIDETEFADGVYPEKFIDFNALKPQSTTEGSNFPFYGDGEAYEWYLRDEILLSADDIKSEYKVVYKALPVPIFIRYYTDEVDEDNLIAETAWAIQINDWPDGEQFSIIDELPNKYIDAFKPIVCLGGQIVNSEQIYTFESLLQQGHIDILYISKEEPHDPDDSDFPQKVLWFNKMYDANSMPNLNISHDPSAGSTPGDFNPWTTIDVPVWGSQGALTLPERNTDVPYFDLGYTPKELGRLRTELKGYGVCGGISLSNINRYSEQGNQFAGIFGYVTAPNQQAVHESLIAGKKVTATLQDYNNTVYTDGAPVGTHAYFGHVAVGGAMQADRIIPLTYDGHQTQSLVSGEVMIGTRPDYNYESARSMGLAYQKGYGYARDEDLEIQSIFNQYSTVRQEGLGYYRDSSDWFNNDVQKWGSTGVPGGKNQNPVRMPNNDPIFWEGQLAKTRENGEREFETRTPAVAFNPLTGVIDSYHDYLELYDYANEGSPVYENVENTDVDVWEWRGKPAGPIRLWVTTNPNNGKPNFSPWKTPAFPAYYHRVDNALTVSAQGNPYNSSFTPGYTYTEWVWIEKGQVEHQEAPEWHPNVGEFEDDITTDKGVWKKVTREKSFAYQGFSVDAYPKLQKSMIWYIKIWDRDRLVRDLIPVAKGDKIYDFIAPANGLFDKVTEIFFSNVNEGGTYLKPNIHGTKVNWDYYTLTAQDIYPVHVSPDPTIWGKIIVNYYDENYHALGSQYVVIPVHYNEKDIPLVDVVHANDFKPDDFHHGGMIDVDGELYEVDDYFGGVTSFGSEGDEEATLKAIYDTGAINIYYKLLTFTKTVKYYRGNTQVGSKDLFYTIEDIRDANSLADLGIDKELYASDDYKPGRIVFDESILANNNIQAFIDAPSPIVIYDEYTKEEKPELLYVNYYRGGANSEDLITLDENNPNYFNCNLDAKVLNPVGCVKYTNHYHTALYADEKQDYFIAYQVDIDSNYVDIHKGPARIYNVLATITDRGRYTVIEEKRGWGRLREYPRGWINLAYTKPVFGPGENPTYDTDTETYSVRIPYETEITISRMTIDRVWGYVPEHASWVKMEEVSCTQLGRLYNALHQDVIHLDEIDWETQPLKNLTDLGVEINKWKLKYHDNSNVDNSSRGRAQWEDQHVVEIVYPETIYAYNVYYYKDTLKPIPEKTIEHEAKYGVGAVKDPETFYYYYSSGGTTYIGDDRYKRTYDRGKLDFFVGNDQFRLKELISKDDKFYWIAYLKIDNTETITYERNLSEVVNKGSYYYVPVEEMDLIFEPENGWTETIPAVNPEIARVSFSCSVTEWNPDWDTFIATSWKTDGDGLPINPTLYRGTEIKLGWDFFGIDNNEFKPEQGYDDGIFIWNPHTYENNDVYFTFEELIQTGTQKVLYLPLYDKYKAAYYLAFTKFHLTDNDQMIQNFSLTPQLTDNGHWDIELKYQDIDTMSFGNDPKIENGHALIFFPKNNKEQVTLFGGQGNSWAYASDSYTTKSGNTITNHPGWGYTVDNKRIPINTFNYGIANFSNRRNTSAVWCQGNDLTGYQSEKYVYDLNGNSDVITRALDTRQSKYYQFSKWEATKKKYDAGEYDDDSNYHPVANKNEDWVHDIQTTTENLIFSGGSQPTYVTTGSGGPYSGSTSCTKGWTPLTTPRILYYFKVWKDFNLVQYWIPVPKGMYLPNGQQVSHNTMYEILSNTLAEPYIFSDEIAGSTASNRKYETVSGDPTIIKLGQPITPEDYNWLLDRWTGYTKEEINLIGKAKTTTKVFDVPSEEGRLLTTYPANFVMPLYEQTADSEYGVQGSWYYNGFGWVKGSYITVLPSTTYSINRIKQEMGIKGDTRNTGVAYNAYLAPDANKSTSAIKFTSELSAIALAETDDFIYTGYAWVPKAYTELYTEPVSATYAVSVAQLKVYKYPIADDAFLVGARLRGERITPNKQLIKDNYWKYIENEGWVDTFEATSEVV